MIAISVIIPTFHRNPELERALRSCLRQDGMRPDQFEIVVVDNSSDGRARPVVSSLAASSPVAIHYHAERRPGITHARNTGVAAASGELIAFLDDDGEADSRWLCSLWSTYEQYHPDLMWGALLPRFEGGLQGWDKVFISRYTRRIGATGTTPKTLHGTNNSCIRRAIIPMPEPFPLQLGLLGGGDIALFRQFASAGRKLAYCAEAIIFDHIPVERISYRYLLRRSFWQGQVTTYMHTLPGFRSPWLLVRSLVAGVVGLVQYGGIAAAQFVLGRQQDAALASLRVARAAGRLMWMRPFRKQRYGITSSPPNLPAPAEARR